LCIGSYFVFYLNAIDVFGYDFHWLLVVLFIY